ncbi:MAG: CoA transferase [Chloroflexi bacterium]|jgi:crotonobetainyl-CoA:carnitine CoA-transferase CaiB-like acyl-CoA transferase|nr:CoA transferase [Dehalococcoidia bacterium]MCO5200922.1 CoA transferase [Chloroflexota bacterium]MCZ7576858.1 CoA transferase [Dehalococcoidia bacterium]
MQTPSETAPLSGIRVVDAGQILAAPFCSTLLGEFGADVIKVEPPGTGDANRGSVSFAQDNRGQKSVTLDVTRPEGAALFRRLCDVSDILVENNRPGALEKWGLAPETLRESNPGLVVVRISGYGQTGPYRDRAGFDRVALAFAGITALTGYPGLPPVRPGYFVADYGAGIFAAFGALAALRARELSGRGQDVDMALYEAVWRMSGTHAANYGLSGKDRERSGNYFPGVVPAEQFETSDGQFLVVNATTQRSFEKLCQAIGQPELVQDPRFTPRKHLLENHAAIHAIVGEWVASRALAECQELLDRFGVPATKVYNTSDIVGDPHFAARQQVISVESTDHGQLLQPGVVPILTETPGQVRGRAPLLGEHNEEVYLGLLGLAEDEYGRLRAAGVL